MDWLTRNPFLKERVFLLQNGGVMMRQLIIDYD